MAYIYQSQNCNFSYIEALSNDNPEYNLIQILTKPPVWNAPVNPNAPKEYKPPTCGMFLFAQGSEHPVDLQPYAPNFKKYIESEKLGTVIELPPVPNRLHNDKPGILFVWIIDHDALANWWKSKHKKTKKVNKE